MTDSWSQAEHWKAENNATNSSFYGECVLLLYLHKVHKTSFISYIRMYINNCISVDCTGTVNVSFAHTFFQKTWYLRKWVGLKLLGTFWSLWPLLLERIDITTIIKSLPLVVYKDCFITCTVLQCKSCTQWYCF